MKVKANSIKKKLVAMLLAVMCVCSMVGFTSTPAHAASYTTVKGILTNSYGTVTNVYTNGKTAKLRICTFSQNGKRTDGKVTVKAVADSGATYTWNVTGCNGLLESTTNVTLPSGNTHYRLYIKRCGTSNSNLTKTYYVSIDFKSNCWH